MNINSASAWRFKSWCICLLALCIVVVSARPLIAATQDNEEILPGNVFTAVQDVVADLETLRLYMGAPKQSSLVIEIDQAAPHDVYYQALTLFEKANRFSFEQLRIQNDQPPLREGVQTPADVLKMVAAADDVLHLVLAELKLPTHGKINPLTPGISPTNVFEAIRQVNRQLNIMLEQRFSPSDVYTQVTFAVGYASNLLEPFTEANRIPDEPIHQQNKVPADVFFRLIDCLDIIARIYQINGFPSLQFEVGKADAGNITPSDVYDVASMVVARLDFLQRQIPDIRRALAPFYPGRKVPSDAYQRAGLLKLQLQELEAQSRSSNVVRP